MKKTVWMTSAALLLASLVLADGDGKEAAKPAPGAAAAPAKPAGEMAKPVQLSGDPRPPAGTKTGDLKFEKTLHDFGKIDQGQVVKTEFAFKNTGSKTIEIKNVGTTCGCTAANLEKKVFAPGEGDVIKVTFNSAGKSGPQSKIVTVTTDEGDNIRYALEMKGEITRDNWLTQPVAFFESIAEGEGASKDIDYIDLRTEPIKITGITTTSEYITAKAGETVPYTDAASNRTGRKTPIHVEVKPGYPAGRLSGNVQIATDNKTQPNQMITVTGKVKGEVDPQPATANFGTLEPNGEKDVIVTLAVSDPAKKVKLVSATPDADLPVKVELVQPTEQGGQAQVKMHAKAAEKPGMIRGNVKIESEVNGKKSVVVVPVWGTIHAPSPAKTGAQAAPAPGNTISIVKDAKGGTTATDSKGKPVNVAPPPAAPPAPAAETKEKKANP